jgi:hypothetical protein
MTTPSALPIQTPAKLFCWLAIVMGIPAQHPQTEDNEKKTGEQFDPEDRQGDGGGLANHYREQMNQQRRAEDPGQNGLRCVACGERQRNDCRSP